MQTVFITRDLTSDSPLLSWASERDITIIHQSLLRFEPIRFRVPPRAEVWFFYSSRAVEFSIDGLDKVDRMPRLAAMGAGTAAALEQRGFPVDFVGQGDPWEVARQFAEYVTSGTVFFPRARQSRRSVQRLLPDQVRVLDAICYDNVAVADPAAVLADAYVFTSPLNVTAYLGAHQLPQGARVVAIGPSTGEALRARRVAYVEAAEPSELGLCAVLKEMD